MKHCCFCEKLTTFALYYGFIGRFAALLNKLVECNLLKNHYKSI